MNQAQYNRLRVGDCVRVRRSGKVYLAGWVETADEYREKKAAADARSMAKDGTPCSWLPAERGLGEDTDVTFVQLRGDPAADHRYGALRTLRADAIEWDAAATRAYVRGAVPRAQGYVAKAEALVVQLDSEDTRAALAGARGYLARMQERQAELGGAT